MKNTVLANKQCNKYNFIHKLFSITNQQSINKKWYKVIYILGVKISFRNKRKEKMITGKNNKQNELIQYINEQSLLNYKENDTEFNVLFFTYANIKYYEFAILYPFFTLLHNPKALVEIILEDLDLFKLKYGKFIDFYNNNPFFKGKVLYRQVDKELLCLHPGTIRFVSQPQCKAEYVYIGDVDIVVLEDVYNAHIKNIEINSLDFSNIKRHNLNKLTGLHFIEYTKMYPLNISTNINLINEIDEGFLYNFMLQKGYRIPDENNITYRPICGIHISYFSRPPLQTLTTNDKCVDFPSWGPFSKKYIERYENSRNCTMMKDFNNLIDRKDIKLRKIIQYIDIVCFYIKNNPQYICPDEFVFEKDNMEKM